MACIVIIPARGGSRGIPGKNLIEFCGRPLLAWSIQQAQDAEHVTDTVVSSDCDEILTVAEYCGAIPVRRPDELATDNAASELALLHALDSKELSARDVDLVVFLQATSPLRQAQDIDAAIEQLRSSDADSLFSASLLEDFCAWRDGASGLEPVTYDPASRGQRQDRTPFYLENGSIYVFKPEVLRSAGNRLGGTISRYLMPQWKSLEIDSAEELELAKGLFQRRILGQSTAQEAAIETPLCLPFSLADIDLLVYDFDGVMTNNKVLVDEYGTETVAVNRGDGLGIDLLRGAGLRQFILSTETNQVVQRRAEKLGLEVTHGARDKLEVMKAHLDQRGIARERTLFVGNDINDRAVMQYVGFSCVPSDAAPEVREGADFTLSCAGGEGVIRELARLLLQDRGVG